MQQWKPGVKTWYVSLRPGHERDRVLKFVWQFFLELWAEINHKALLRSRAQATALLPDPRSGDDDVPEGTIFEELVVQYGKLVGRAEDMIVHTVCGEVEAGLRAHYSAGGSSYVISALLAVSVLTRLPGNRHP